MTEPAQPKPLRRRRVAKPASPAPRDMRELIAAMERLACALEPLAEHVPALVEVAEAWTTGKSAGAAVGRTARWAGSAARWASGFIVSLTLLWAAWTHKWDALTNAQIRHN